MAMCQKRCIATSSHCHPCSGESSTPSMTDEEDENLPEEELDKKSLSKQLG